MGQRVWCDLPPRSSGAQSYSAHSLRENMAGGGTGHRVSAMRQPETDPNYFGFFCTIFGADAAYDL